MILISGEALIDLIPDPEKDGRYDAVRGGSPYNVAIGLARLGVADRIRFAHVRRTPTAKRSPRPRRAMASISPSSCGTSGRRPSLSSCGAPPRPVRAIPSTSTRPRSTDPGRFRRSGRRSRAICMSARSPPSIRVMATGWSRRSRRRDRTRPQLRSEHPPAGHAEPRCGRRAGRAAGVARPCREGERRGPAMALSGPLG